MNKHWMGFAAAGGILILGAWSGACSAASDDDPGGTQTAAGGATGTATPTAGEGGMNLGGGLNLGGQGGGSTFNPCKVPPHDDDANPVYCEDKAPPDSFAPVTQWEWTAPAPTGGSMYSGSFVTPLVGNFTDDNADGAIDLCDVPDIVVSAIETFSMGGGGMTLASNGKLHLLSGDTGAEILSFAGSVDSFVYPAFGDIDGDGMPELLAADPQAHLVAYEHDGTLKWTGAVGGYRASFASGQCTTINIYDLDGDGTPEILFGFEVFDNQGARLWGVPGNAAAFNGQFWCVTPTAADLDGDGKLEVLFGHQTYHDDGTLYWELSGQPPAHPHVANLDSDPEPEVFLTNTNGIFVLEHDGTLKFGPVRPTGENPAPNCWGKPGVVHDFDGDGVANIAASTCTVYAAYTVGASDVTSNWTANVQDLSGLATATAFDFLGDAVAEGIYADETTIFVFDGVTGAVSMTAPRSSGTLIEYPVVADVDNDESAEIVYVSNYLSSVAPGPTLVVLRDGQDRWIPARRIWNQYSYHVTNVREDSTIPPVQKRSWEHLNTFRTNSQIGVEGDCIPEPPR
ncbi:MAG: VCBS repeat-containing protein [Deltaproteobacteria bacterium]|jgi:hypothetical protein|nr:VCBS repeat-containing protein [Deltaproteobacteria bacterium]MBW2535620.1 VCBS repeat-containing protein [Deltaproteobacteria bacterium]